MADKIDTERLTPIQILAVTLAYMTEADNVHEKEERAELIVVFNKMVTRGEMNQQGLAALIAFAFDYAKDRPLEDFLKDAAPRLTPLQKASIYINALDLMLADGRVVGGEQDTIKKIQDALGLDQDTVMAIREIIFVKNDTRMFLHPEHPRNAMDAFLRVSYRPAAAT